MVCYFLVSLFVLNYWIAGGTECLINPPTTTIDKGTAFTEEERDALGLRGLLPPIVETLEDQAARALQQFRSQKTTIEKYNFLTVIRYTNEILFYHLLTTNMVEMVPIVYTPTVGQACVEFGQHYKWAEGMYITPKDKGQIRSILNNWKRGGEEGVSIIVVTDGSRILGLGDLGAGGLGISIGKLQLYVAGAGFNPENTLPIILDTGTKTERYLKNENEHYLGIPQKRLPDPEYYDFVEEFLMAVKDKWPRALLQFEDFSNDHCFSLLEKYQDRLRCFNDDIQGTGAVIAAGFINAVKTSGVSFKDQRIVFLGAGSAGIGVADQIADVMVTAEEGLTLEEARKRFYFVDSQGLVTTNRGGKLQSHKVPYARTDYEKVESLLEIVKTVKPTSLIGLSGMGGSFTEEILKEMAAINDRPVIFALSNPTANSECSAAEAYTASAGRAIFASGSPFQPVEIDGKKIVPGQGNNMYIFPGLGFGAWLCQSKKVSSSMITVAAMTLAGLTAPEDLEEGNMYPKLTKIREISAAIATAVIEQAYAEGLATIERPSDILSFVKSKMWHPSY